MRLNCVFTSTPWNSMAHLLGERMSPVVPGSASPEHGLALLAPRRVALGLVLGQLEGREAIEIDQQIAAEGHDAADPDGVSVDGADQRLRKIPEHLERAIPSPGDAPDEVRGGLHGVGLRILQVRPGGEGAAGLVAGEDGAADLVVVLHGGEVAGESLVEVGAPRVARPGSAEGDDTDVIAFLVGDGHGDVLISQWPSAGMTRSARSSMVRRTLACSIPGHWMRRMTQLTPRASAWRVSSRMQSSGSPMM